jgi:Zn-dependent M28 family amino/carboxypeptidase
MSKSLPRCAAASLAAAGLAILSSFCAVSPTVAQTAPADVAARMEKHLAALQRIADENGGNRAAGTSGYRASVDYAARVLEKAGYDVTRQSFEIASYRLTERPVVALVRPEKRRLRERKDYLVVNFSGSVSVQSPIVAAGGTRVPPPADGKGLKSGCSPDDFPAATRGAIALVQRGGCNFTEKFENAEAAGAVAMLIFNSGLPGEKDVLTITAENDNTLPIAFLSYKAGRDLFRSAEVRRTVVRLDIRGKVSTKPTWNLLADSSGGDPDKTLVVGGHLDSVPDGPGINDNGSGTALVLVAAERMAERWEKPRNRVRFALWGAEEMGLLGSNHYVATLPKRERKRIFAYLNFDMVASPNFVRFVDATRGNAASQAVGEHFHAAFKRKGLPSGHTDSGGRTDTFAFIEAGIPAAGLFSGAEGEKTRSQQKRYGGRAGEPYDACYHQPCDTIDNISRRALREFSDAAFEVIREMARKKPSAAEATAAAVEAATTAPLYRGPYALR